MKPDARRWSGLILPGATLRDRAIACTGALLGIGLTAALCRHLFPAVPLLVAPMGASAVLLFAVPASPLAQPWPIIGGNIVSALTGVAVGRVVHDPALAAGLAVALAIAAMSLTRCLHPPGGAAALTAILGGNAVAAAGFTYAFLPVGVNSVLLVALGWLFHRVTKRRYPHQRPRTAASSGVLEPDGAVRRLFAPEDLDAALAELGEPLDVQREDIERLLSRIESHAILRSGRSGAAER